MPFIASRYGILVLLPGETTVPRGNSLISLLMLTVVGLAVLQPVAARANALPILASAEDVSQSDGSGRGAQPGPIVRQAFDILMDRFVIPPKSGNVLNGGLDGAHFFLESKKIADPLAQRPDFTGDRREDWRLFLPAYDQVTRALGTTASHEDLDRAMVDG